LEKASIILRKGCRFLNSSWQ